MEFLQYFPGVFAPVPLLLLGGTIGGPVLGATPGLSPTMAVALRGEGAWALHLSFLASGVSAKRSGCC